MSTDPGRPAKARLGLLLAFLLLVALAPASAAGAGPARWSWRFDQSGSAPGVALAIARSESGQIAVGATRGVALAVPGSTRRRFSMRAPVTDLAFDTGDRLWVATANGVFRLDPGAVAPRDVSPRGGELGRAVSRLVTAGPEVAIATAAGVFWRRGGAPWQRIDAALGDGRANALALVARGDEPSELWISTGRSLQVVHPDGDGTARNHPLPMTVGPIADLHAEGGSVWVLTTRSLIDVAGDGIVHPVQIASGATAEAATGANGEEPSVERRRLKRLGGAFFLATTRGLWLAPGPGGPWRRAAEPAGYAAWTGLAVWRGGVALAGPRGVLRGTREAAQPPPRSQPRASETKCAPPIAEVHRAVLSYLELRGDPVARMRRGVRKRGWLPELKVQGRYVTDRGRGRDFDQNYVSGGLRELNDWDDDSARARDVSVALTWELGDLAYHPEEIDVSTEARRLIELRDDVLDEVNQLYFDRERALREGADGLQAARFAAGLDGWTDGWFSRATHACRSQSRPSPAD